VTNLSSLDKKKLNTSNNKSYNILKQKIKKNNVPIKEQIDDLKEKSPNLFDSDQEEEDSDTQNKKSKKKVDDSDDDLQSETQEKP